MPPTPRTALGSLLAISFVVAGCADASTDSSPTTQSETTTTASTTTTVTETTREVDDDHAAPTRPPLPTDPPDGPRVDRFAERLPDDFEPVVWRDPPPRPALDGPLAANRLIARSEIHGERQLAAAEDIAPGLDGHLYTGTEDGGIWRVVVDGADVERIERVATVEGRPLGIDAYSEDVLIVASALEGLIAVDVRSGDSWVLSDRLDGASIFFADGVAVATDGTIYFTEASTRYYPGFPLDFLDGRPNGRLLRYEPTTGATDVVVDGLYFANGVVVDPDESYALVAESFRFRITRVSLADDRFGATEQFGPALINGPDNLRLDEQGRVWVGGSDLRNDLVDVALTNADLRRQLATAAPDDISNVREPYGFAQVLSPDGSPCSASTTAPAGSMP